MCTTSRLDCEQSLFFFRLVRGVHTRARAAKPRDGRNEGVPLPSRAISFARGHLRVSRFARRTTEKGETARSLPRVGSSRDSAPRVGRLGKISVHLRRV